jgi:hypothetical protein
VPPATGTLVLPADSDFYSREIPFACRRHRAHVLLATSMLLRHAGRNLGKPGNPAALPPSNPSTRAGLLTHDTTATGHAHTARGGTRS